MSYSPRGSRGPNVSQYLANLNAIPPTQETTPENYLEDDLALFTNVEFLDNFDLGETLDIAGVDFPQQPGQAREQSVGAKDAQGNVKDLNFGDGYQFNDLGFPAEIQTGIPPTDFAAGPYPASTSSYTPTSATAGPRAGDKRSYPHHPSPTPADLETQSRAAAEEDKRRRNTAASARFRVKKKQREQALEKSAKEMTDKVEALEDRVAELERENKWLRGLVVEKSSVSAGSNTEVLNKIGEKATDERSSSLPKRGIGTVKIGDAESKA